MPRLKGSKIIKFKDNKNIKSKNILLEQKIKLYFDNNHKNLMKIYDIKHNKHSVLNFNLIKFFIFIYCDKYKIFIDNFNIYDRYKMITKSYSRKQFSLSNVKHTISFNINNKIIKFPITNLHVFYWLFKHNIIDYIEDNIDIISKEKKKYKDAMKVNDNNNNDKLIGTKEKTE